MSVIELKRKIDFDNLKPWDVIETSAVCSYDDLEEDFKNKIDEMLYNSLINAPPTAVDKNNYDELVGWKRVFFRGFETNVNGIVYLVFTPCNLTDTVETPDNLYRKKFNKYYFAPAGTYTHENGDLKCFDQFKSTSSVSDSLTSS